MGMVLADSSGKSKRYSGWWKEYSPSGSEADAVLACCQNGSAGFTNLYRRGGNAIGVMGDGRTIGTTRTY